MSVENQSAGDGVLADQGSQDFGDLTGSSSTQNTQQGASQNTGGQTDGSQNQQQGQQGQQTQTNQQTGQTQTSQQQAVPPLQAPTNVGQQQPDHAAIIRATVEATANAMAQRNVPAQQQTQQRELSADEFNQRYGIVRPNEQMLTAILGQDPKAAVATLDNLFQANLVASMRMANDIIEAKMKQLDDRYRPHIDSWQQHRQTIANQEAESRFFKAFPDLANERETVMEMKDAFITKVNAGQIRFANEQEAFNAVATATRSLLQRVRGGGQGSTQTGQSHQNQHQSSGRQMSVASSAGRTGTGQAAAKGSIVDEVFGVDARWENTVVVDPSIKLKLPCLF